MSMVIMRQRTKKYKFQVAFTLEELSSVPYVNQVLFAKCRLTNTTNGHFRDTSGREEVRDHRCQWSQRWAFASKMRANASTGTLEPCVLRVSVRKESRGGRSYHKLGFADINLAEFAGAGCVARRYLLEPYDNKHHRSDNSTLLVTIDMTLLAGDPCFKAPTFYTSLFHTPGDVKPGGGDQDSPIGGLEGPPVATNTPNKTHKQYDTMSTTTTNVSSVLAAAPVAAAVPTSGSGSTVSSSAAQQSTVADSGQESGHSRNSSQASSRVSGYNSLPSHSRQGSADSGNTRNSIEAIKFNSTERKRITSSAKKIVEEQSTRMDSTRVSNERLINELLEQTNLEGDDYDGECNESVGLELIVGKDGSTTLGTKHSGRSTTAATKPNHRSAYVGSVGGGVRNGRL